jgi:isochorismate pyruvate lyase
MEVGRVSATEVTGLNEVREQIDRVDREIVRLLAERSGYVRQVVRFKRTADDAHAPARVEQVIARVRAHADAMGAEPDLVERLYRVMIDWFTEAQLKELAGRR